MALALAAFDRGRRPLLGEIKLFTPRLEHLVLVDADALFYEALHQTDGHLGVVGVEAAHVIFAVPWVEDRVVRPLVKAFDRLPNPVRVLHLDAKAERVANRIANHHAHDDVGAFALVEAATCRAVGGGRKARDVGE